MASPESKLEEFKEVGLAMAAPLVSAMLPGGKPIETLANVFSIAHGQAEQSIQTSLVQQVWAGMIDPSQLSIRVNGADAAAIAALLRISEAKKSCDNHLFLIALNDLDAQAAALRALADKMEEGFVSKYGDAWAEDLALEILEEDQIPQRRDGESIEDYRARVEEALIDEMIDENGEIKVEYKDHPEYGDRAEWAKTRYDEQAKVRRVNSLRSDLNDGSLSDLDRKEAISEASFEEKIAVLDGASGAIVQEVSDALDSSVDGATQVQSASIDNSFMGG